MDNYDLIIEDADKFKDYFLNDEREPISYFPKFTTINIIIGANNSGKSRFMRYLMSFGSFVGIHDINFIKKEIEEYNLEVSSLNQLKGKKIQYFERLSFDSRSSIDRNNFDLMADRLRKIKITELNLTESDEILPKITRNKESFNKIIDLDNMSSYIENYSTITNDFRKEYTHFKKYYIPTLRTAHSLFKKELSRFQKIENDVYLETLNKYYELDEMNVEVFTGIHLYKDILNTRNSKREVRQSFEKFEVFIGKYFFEGKKIDIVAEFNKDESLNGNNDREIISVHI